MPKILGPFCDRGHRRSENTIVNPKTGVKSCKACRDENQKKSYKREKELQKKALESILK